MFGTKIHKTACLRTEGVSFGGLGGVLKGTVYQKKNYVIFFLDLLTMNIGSCYMLYLPISLSEN